ncbi:MAG: response regulator [Proteobacteria bacterium]|nr:response regulator [Pseudomonadota bacterium]MBU4328706.1 response regulator [Pseudomonadota bacterium]MBU4585879.1 response regulator [Pseudomonadota bacterium]
MMQNNKTILLVEDDAVDAMTVRRAFKDLQINNPLHHAENGEQALTWLRDPAIKLPCLILLDMNMPRMNGTEFLREAKAEPCLRKIPVVVLTTSEEERDRAESFNLGVAGYMLKPVDYNQFIDVVRIIDLYWTLSKLAPWSTHDK